MRKLYHTAIMLWFGWTTPPIVADATIFARERMRKAHLLSTAIFILTTGAFFSIIALIPTGDTNGPFISSGVLVILGVVAWLNRHGHLYAAGYLFIGMYIIAVVIGFEITVSTDGIVATYQWVTFIIVPIFAGITLPYWAPMVFGVMNTIIVLVLYGIGFQQHQLSFLSDQGDQVVLLIVASGFILSIAAMITLYTRSVEKAVIEADRAVELETANSALEQAHSALATAYEQLEELSTRDSITGLLNQRALHKLLPIEAERSKQTHESLGVIFADLDHFKHVNDTWGHHAGDIALAHLAECLRANVRATDIVARYGGEEFIVVMPGQGTSDVAQMAERLRTIVATSPVVLPDGQSINITLSLGVAVLPDDADTVDAILIAADAAMYHAKHNGRNRVCVSSQIREAEAAA